MFAPNPRLQRTPSASPPSPLSRQPLGSRELPATESAGHAYGTVRKHGSVESVGETGHKSECVRKEPLRVARRLESVGAGQLGAVPNPAVQRTRSRGPLTARPLGGRESPSVFWAGHDDGSGQARVAVASGGRNSLEVALSEQEQLRGSAPLESISVGQHCAPPNPRLQRTRWRSPLSRQPLGAAVKS